MELLKSVVRTVLPNGEIIHYEHGALIERKPANTKDLNKWYRWLHRLKVKYNWETKPLR